MNQTRKKIGRNERCHCGSGKKYKHCHLALDEQQRHDEAVKAPPAADDSPGPAKIADIPKLLEELSRTGSAKDRAEFADLRAKVGPLLAYMEKQGEIEAAGAALEAHRAEFEKLLADQDAYMDRASALFADECFAPLRFTAAEIRRAFDHVGYPAIASPNERTGEILRAAILYLADKDRRSHCSMGLLLHLPAFVAAGRRLDGWLIQHCAHETSEYDEESNSFLFAMFSQGYDAWSEEKRAQSASALRKLGLAPEGLSSMSLDEIDAWLQAQGKDPAQRAKAEAFMEQHPDLRFDAVANLEAIERDSVKLLEHPDAGFLLLPLAEVGPWLQRLNQLLVEAQARLPKEPDGTLTKAAATQMFDAIVPVLQEMAQAIFTPARLQQLLIPLKEFRRQQFAAGNKAVANSAMGAITSVERETEPGQNYFLINLCFASLKSPAAPEADLEE